VSCEISTGYVVKVDKSFDVALTTANMAEQELISRRAISSRVTRVLTREVWEDLLAFVEQRAPELWGMEQGDDYLESNLLLVIYKAITGVGYNALISQVDFVGPETGKTFSHNACILRAEMASWAHQYITVGTKRDWNTAAADVKRPDPFDEVNMWIDSTDVPKTRKKGVGTKHPDWSYKLNGPGRRYMLLQNGQNKILKIWGGYTPKLYDGDFLDLKKEWFRRHLDGAHVIGDDHFRKGKEYFRSKKHPKFHIPYRITEAKSGNSDPDLDDVLPKGKQRFNKRLHKLRSRVEIPFGWVKNSFASISTPWPEAEQQLDYLIVFAFGVHNLRIDNAHVD
jgi:hypothetical protein